MSNPEEKQKLTPMAEPQPPHSEQSQTQKPPSGIPAPQIAMSPSTASQPVQVTQKTSGSTSSSHLSVAAPTPPSSESSAPSLTPPSASIPPSTERKPRARGTAAMDPQTRREVARKGGLAVSRNKQHMAEIGRKGGQSVSKNREHMAQIGRKGGAASRGHRTAGR